MDRKKRILILKGLADETRLKIMEILLEGKKCVCEIFPKVNRTQSTVSIQLGKLESFGLVESKREGKRVFYKIKDLMICDIFKALGYEKGRLLKKKCCINEKRRVV